MIALAGWWFVLSAIGWLSWPLAAQLFRGAPGRGYAYARGLGLLFVAYPFWISSFLTGISNTRGVLWAFVGLVAMVSALAWVRHSADLRAFLRQEIAHIITVEILFAACFALYAVQRSYHPAITHTEQPMDFAFLNGILASPRMPPHDPWLSGFSISYYYLGYLMAAVMARLTGISSNIGYNLALAQVFALTAVAAYGLVHDLIRAHITNPEGARSARAYGLVGAVAITLASNLVGILEGLKALGWGSETFFRWFRVTNLATAMTTHSWLPLGDWWWWRASRIITDSRLLVGASQAITEFPAFSFILGDLHPHVMALPYLILTLGVAHELYTIAQETIPSGWWRQWRFWAIPLIVGALGLLNTWDLPVALAACVLAVILGITRGPRQPRPAVLPTLLVLLWLVGGSALYYAPHYMVMHSQVEGLGVAYWAKTPLRHYLLCFGLWLLPIVAELFANSQQSSWKSPRHHRWRGVGLLWAAILLLSWLGVLLVGGWGRLVLTLMQIAVTGPWLILGQSLILALVIVDLANQLGLKVAQRSDCRIMIRLLTLLGIGLTYATEYFYVKDLFDTRANTLFKVYNEAWILLALAAILALFRLRSTEGWPKLAYAPTWLILVACLYYPAAAFYTRAQGYRGDMTLDGTAFLQRVSAAEHRAYEWLLNARVQGVIVEAPGQDYVAATSRMSAWTGMPTIVGWPGHEAQWRGDDRVVQSRIADVDRLYTVPDQLQVLALLRQYDATFLFVGPYERQRYQIDTHKLNWFASFLDVQYAEGDTHIFSVPQRRP